MNIIETLKGVTTGLYNSMILNEEIEKIAQERLEICKGCEHFSTPDKVVTASKCNLCGCYMKLKSRVMSAECGIKEYNQRNKTNLPLKWVAVVDDKTQQEIDQLI